MDNYRDAYKCNEFVTKNFTLKNKEIKQRAILSQKINTKK